MKVALTACFAVTMAAAATSALAQDVAPVSTADRLDVALVSSPASATGIAFDPIASIPPGPWIPTHDKDLNFEKIPAGVPLRVQLDKSYRIKVGSTIQGHLIEPVYLVDHVALPANSKIFGQITGKHPVSRRKRAAAMFNGDLTPLKNAEVTFTDVQTPDGRDFPIATLATERTAEIVRMADPTITKRRSFKQKIAAAFRWTKQQTMAALTSDHKSDLLRQELYKQMPLHPQEMWIGTQFDAELTQPLELTGQQAPEPIPAANLDSLKLEGTIEARLIDSVDSATAHPGMPVEAVLTQPLFEDAPESVTKVPATKSSTHAKGRLLLPEGTRLIGTVVQAKAAGIFGHNGTLRLTFRKAELPAGDVRVLHGQITAAESDKSAHLKIDDEGGARATNGAGHIWAPITSGSLAAVGNNTGSTLMREALTSNGMDLVTQACGTAFSVGGLTTGFTYYEASKVVFDEWINRGHNVVFARNTRIEIQLAQR
jgi:hypothetical protein